MSLPRWLWFEHKPWLSRCCKWITEMWKEKGQFVRGNLESRNLITKAKCIEMFYYYFLIQITNTWGFAGGWVGKESACNAGNAGKCKFGPWVRKIPWRRKWQPTPIFLPGRILWTEEPGGLQSIGSQRVGQDWNDGTHTHTQEIKSSPRVCPQLVCCYSFTFWGWKKQVVAYEVSACSINIKGGFTSLLLWG